MKRSIALLFASLLVALPALVRADMSGVPSAAEVPFVKAVTADLNARFPTEADAEKAGYIRYTDEDDTGAISYARRKWTSKDIKHPSQLWYDAGGRLIGADFSIRYTDDAPPHLFGVDPKRWSKFGDHDHYGLNGPDGKVIYGYTTAQKIAAAGGNPAHPVPADLVAIGIAKSPAEVRFVFNFPSIWDLSVWVIPNANGAFADKNPAVKPVNPPKPGMNM